MGSSHDRSWWHQAVFYEVYIRSFADSNDDGIGDLPGVISRLDYLKSLGVDALWLTPFYPSPQKDGGYDVSDYYGVNPEYGTVDDFDQLIAHAHQLGIKVLVDLVPNHTSSRHPWFEAALSAADDPHRALYHFAPGRDGSSPNNWQSSFGGSAWTREERWGHWYLHLFAREQPDLNWYDPAVPREFERILKFWLDRGVDGYRIDVAVALFKRKDLADRPMVRDPRTGELRPAPGFSIIDQPEVHGVYRSWRGITESYEPERVLVGEIFDPARHPRYVRRDQLHMAFALVNQPWDAGLWKRSIDVFYRAAVNGTSLPSWTLSNHDVERHVTRLGGRAVGTARARAAALLLLGLPGQYFLYQGEELGLEEAQVPPERRQDPMFFSSGGRRPGRDGCRVPLPWRQGGANAGFSRADPWLPMPGGWSRFAVDVQARSATSVLSLYRKVLGIRRRLSLPPEFRWTPVRQNCLRYVRGGLTVVCNLDDRPLPLDERGRLLVASEPGVLHRRGRLELPGNSAAWLWLTHP